MFQNASDSAAHSAAGSPQTGLLGRAAQGVGEGLADRLTLLLNHLINAEEAARQRLVPHAGQVLRLALDDWPPAAAPAFLGALSARLPAPPPIAWVVSRAGLLERCHAAPETADLDVRLSATRLPELLQRALAGERPPVHVSGEAHFAADVGWLLENLRWDLAADLEQVVGRTPAAALEAAGRRAATALPAALEAARALAERLRPRP